jgi:4-hydroxybutyrate dehydrogenase
MVMGYWSVPPSAAIIHGVGNVRGGASVAFIQYMARIQFDFGARHSLASELAYAGITRPLVVSDVGIAAHGLLDLALEALPANISDSPRYLGVSSNPDLACVEAAIELYRAAACDGVIAVGGGSPIDAGKAVALVVTHAGPLEAYRVERGATISPIAPMIAMPTTAGTGSEIGRGMGIVLDGTHKGVFISPNLIPRAAICDPELTLGLPPKLTAGTGIDALSHCLESFLSPAVNPPADAVALDGIQRIAKHLPRAVANGQDRAARWNVMMGAIEAGMVTWKGLGAAHALSIPLERPDVHHGTLIGVLLPHATAMVLRDVADEKRERLAIALGCSPDGIAKRLETLAADIALPVGLRVMGLADGDPVKIGAAAADTSFNRNIARPASTNDYCAVIQAAL